MIVYTEPIRNEEGEITAVMEMSTDITDIKRLQKQLRDSQAHYRTLFEEVPCYISIQDRDLNIVDANRLHRETFGDFLGCKCFEIYKHRNEECYPCTVRESFEDGQLHVHEEVVTSSDGRAINVLVHTTPIIGAVRPDRRRHGDERRHHPDPATAVAAVLHRPADRVDLARHQGPAQRAERRHLPRQQGAGSQDDQARVAQGWEIVQRNIERIRSMVLDILYYAKDREPDWKPVSAGELVQEVADAVRDKAAELGLEFAQEIGPDAGTFEADGKALRAMLVNLTENAIDACRLDKAKKPGTASSYGHPMAAPPCGSRSRTTASGWTRKPARRRSACSSRRRAARARASGCSSPTRSPGPTAGPFRLSQRPVKAPGFSCRFHAPDPYPLTRARARSPLGHTDMADKQTILIIDDEPDTVTYFSSVLEDAGYATVTAKDGAEGIERVRQARPDLITLDVTMPETSGVRCYRDLRESEDWQSIPVIIITGVSGDFRTFISSRKHVPPPDGYLGKPVDATELLALVRSLLPA